jgi:UDP-N-acetylmuramyl pentapeptide phosphotransferase/UDP-N-acetylglucosamine-1-phosphate transferase
VLLLGLWFGATLAASLCLTAAVLPILRRRAILDRPNERSSHAVPTPRGGGVAIMAALLPGWAALELAGLAPPAIWAAISGAVGLALVSFIDDLRPLPVVVRLLVQFAAVFLAVAALPGSGNVFQGLLPSALDRAVSAVLWVWFLNLFNFMDGIDGIAGTEAACLGVGVALVALLDPSTSLAAHPALGLTLAAASLGFLWWNWHPARLFMGDVGSVPLGFLLGWLLLSLAAAGEWVAALVLPLYYLVDASWTLMRRLLRGATVWRAHREHFYQRAAQAGLSHAAVVTRILIANLALVVIAVSAVRVGAAMATALSVATVAMLLFELARARPRALL